MNKEEFLNYLDRIEQDIRDIEGDEESMRMQLIEIADSIMDKAYFISTGHQMSEEVNCDFIE